MGIMAVRSDSEAPIRVKHEVRCHASPKPPANADEKNVDRP